MPDNETAALDFLERLLREAEWFISAIELNNGVNGYALEEQAHAILTAAGRTDLPVPYYVREPQDK